MVGPEFDAPRFNGTWFKPKLIDTGTTSTLNLKGRKHHRTTPVLNFTQATEAVLPVELYPIAFTIGPLPRNYRSQRLLRSTEKFLKKSADL